jgi:hypothetical protein
VGRLGDLYAVAQLSPNLFASPLGPFTHEGRQGCVPRFVFFGPHASDESWRLALLAGFDRRDARASLALISVVEELAADAGAAHGLHLAFFPVVDAAGAFLGAPYRGLSAHHWGRAAAPELRLLERDARQQAYHGFIRLETAAAGEDAVTVRVCTPVCDQLSPDVELFTSEDAGPFPVRLEAGLGGKFPVAGPLSVSDDLPFTPFELTVLIPASWPERRYARAASIVLRRFLVRYRAFQSFGQNL